MFIHSLVQFSAEAAEAGEKGEVSPYIYGGFALVVLLLLLIIVTRLNINR